MHDADQEGTSGKAAEMSVLMRAVAVSMAPVCMTVKMFQAVGVSMKVEMDPLAANSPDDIETEEHEHKANGQFEQMREFHWQGSVKNDDCGPDQEQAGGVTSTPDHAELHGTFDVWGASCQRCNGGDVIGFQGVAKPDQEAQQKQ